MIANSEKHLTALITGASEGIGLELARIMAREGWDLVLVARREQILRELSAELEAMYNVSATPLPFDLSIDEAPERIHSVIRERNMTVDALVNNAGFGLIGPYESHDPTRIRDMIQVNVSALAQLTRLFIPDLRNRPRGYILNNASVAGFMPIPLFAVYAASKAFVVNLSEALSVELEGTNVSVTCLNPGPTRTGFRRVAGYKRSARSGALSMRAKDVAIMGYQGMLAGRRSVVTGARNKLIVSLSGVIPRRLIVRLSKFAMKHTIS